MQREVKPVVLIAGPTASGKSALALEIARAFGGTVINADSMQVYGGLRILTARPSEDEERLVPHQLYGHVQPSEAYSVARWLKDAREVLAHTEGLPIFVGGTGLYFLAAQQGIAEVPEPDPAIRSHYRSMAAEALHEELSVRAPAEAARLRPSDRQRLSRALEVLESTGRPLGDFHAQAQAGALFHGMRMIRIYLEPERSQLYTNINSRFAKMLAAGALAEVAGLARLGLALELPAMKAHGVPELLAQLSGQLSPQEAETRACLNTRHYAKRQMTWARRNMISWEFHIAQFSEKERADIFAFIRKKG